MRTKRHLTTLAALGSTVVLVLSTMMTPASAVVRNGTAGPDSLKGTQDADVLRGFAGSDDLRGFGGDDTLLGGDGGDSLLGGRGADVLKSGQGGGRFGDLGFGGLGHDTMYGHGGPNFMLGGAGNDTMYGWRGKDDLNPEAGADVIRMGAGNDFSTTLTHDGKRDVFWCGPGHDRLTYFDGDTIDPNDEFHGCEVINAEEPN